MGPKRKPNAACLPDPHLVRKTNTCIHTQRLISLAAVIGAALPVARWAKAEKSKHARDVTLAHFMTDPAAL